MGHEYVEMKNTILLLYIYLVGMGFFLKLLFLIYTQILLTKKRELEKSRKVF